MFPRWKFPPQSYTERSPSVVTLGRFHRCGQSQRPIWSRDYDVLTGPHSSSEKSIDLVQGHIPEERRSRSVKSVQFCPGHVWLVTQQNFSTNSTDWTCIGWIQMTQASHPSSSVNVIKLRPQLTGPHSSSEKSSQGFLWLVTDLNQQNFPHMTWTELDWFHRTAPPFLWNVTLN